MKNLIKKIIAEYASNVNMPEYFYHGTNKYFTEFDLTHMGKNHPTSILGLYFTQYLKPPPYGSTAKEYAEYLVTVGGGEPYIYKCKIEPKNPLFLNSNGWYSSNTYIDKNRNDIKQRMISENNDCVIAYDFTEKDDFIVATSDVSIITIVDIAKLKQT